MLLFKVKFEKMADTFFQIRCAKGCTEREKQNLTALNVLSKNECNSFYSPPLYHGPFSRQHA
jgi:hypothetical protein